MAGLDWTPWLGKARDEVDWVTASHVAAWNATFDRDVPFPNEDDRAPIGFHWALFPPLARASDLGDDGHARTGTFLPPVPLPRRMWAGSRIRFHHPLHVGGRVDRRSVVSLIVEKASRTGPLIFVTVRHSLTSNGLLALEEDQDLVYRDAASADANSVAEPSPTGAWRRTVNPDETLLFRYSALTFTGPRIHYDRRYAEETDGYPGLVVHAPLIATLLLQLLTERKPDNTVTRFQFKARRPTFDVAPFEIHGDPTEDPSSVRLWSTSARGETAVEAEAWIK
ncbi:MAG: FAS1-like dehydratase domain-containing protein [Gemmatimonadaceae bacterium]